MAGLSVPINAQSILWKKYVLNLNFTVLAKFLFVCKIMWFSIIKTMVRHAIKVPFTIRLVSKWVLLNYQLSLSSVLFYIVHQANILFTKSGEELENQNFKQSIVKCFPPVYIWQLPGNTSDSCDASFLLHFIALLECTFH